MGDSVSEASIVTARDVSLSIAVVDSTGKVTVSLGGSCRLRCTHCYITTPQFRFTRNLTVTEVMEALLCAEGFSTVCISGDVDPFLKEKDFCALLERIVFEIRPRNIMFTSRLSPSDATLNAIERMVNAMKDQRALLVPCVSLVTASYPNQFEDSGRVPPPSVRLGLMKCYREMGAPVFTALRPTFPFSLIPAHEVDAVLELISGTATCVLGEVFLLDGEGDIVRRLGLPAGQELAVQSPLTFLNQGNHWEKRAFKEEMAYVRQKAQALGMPYFLRSMSAIRFLESHWDPGDNAFRSTMKFPSSGCYDHLPP